MASVFYTNSSQLHSSIQTDKDNKEIYNLTHYETELIKEKPKPIKAIVN